MKDKVTSQCPQTTTLKLVARKWPRTVPIQEQTAKRRLTEKSHGIYRGRLENGTYRNIYLSRLENEVTATSNGAGWKKRSHRDVYRGRLVKEVIGADW